MKEYTICLLFLLFVTFNDGHTLARIELNNITDVYEVKEGQSTLTITHPEDDKAILREIVYFHVIEKPYTKQDEVAKTPELNTRSFTNGHGYQYIDGNNDVIDNIEREDNDDGDGDGETPVAEQDDDTLDQEELVQEQDDDTSEKEEPVQEQDDDTLDQEEPVQEQDDDTSDQEYYAGDKNKIGAKATESTTGQDDEESDENQRRAENTTKEDLSGEIKNDVNDKEIRSIDDTEIPKGRLNENDKEPENLDVRFGEPDNTPIDNEPIQVQSESRRKREIDYGNIPDAPELPKFKLDLLPDFIKAIILAGQNDDLEKDNIEDEIEKQVQELKRTVNHPPSVEMENDKMNARTIGNSLDIDRNGGYGQNEATYGMSLAGNSGKVWNNVNTHHLHYVGEPETHNSPIPVLDITDSTTGASIATDDPSETSYDDIRVNNDYNKLKNSNNDFKDFEDSFGEAKKQLKELIQNSEDESIAPTTVTDTLSDDNNNIEYSYIAEQPTSMKDNYNKKREVGKGNSIKDGKKGSQKREVRTYGMSLAEDSGVVWNDVNSHISYHVGKPDTIKKTTSVPEDVTTSTTKASTTVSIDNDVSKESKEVNDLDELKDIEESLDQINKMLEELINSTKEAEPSTDKSTNTTSNNNDNGDSSEKNNKDSELKNTEDSFDEINKLLEELIKNSTSAATTESNRDTKEPDYENKNTTISTTKEASFTESTPLETTTTELTTTTSTTLNKTTDISTSTPKPDIENPDDNDTERNHNNKTTKHDNEDSKQKQFVKELMKNKFFWQWLQDSSAAYLEVMMKKLDDLIKAEVDKQIKQYFEEHKNVTNCNPENKEPHNNTSEKPVESNNATDIDTTVTTEKPVEPNSDLNQNNTTQNPVVNKEPKEELNNTIDQTENNNSTEDDLARRQNKDSNDKKDTPVKIEAKNVYGNSVGNGKVTNIFIFNISKESDLEKIKPLSNGTNGVFVFGLDDKSDKGEVKEQNKDDKNEQSKDVTAKPEIINEHKDDNKQVTDQVTTAKPEIVTNPATEEPKDDSIDSTSENIVEEKQTTSTESSETTTVTHVDEVPSTTKKVIESTTEAKESSTENSKDKTVSDEAKQADPDKPSESPENDSTTQNNDDKPAATSQLDDTTKDKNDITQEPDKDSDIAKTTTESNEANAN